MIRTMFQMVLVVAVATSFAAAANIAHASSPGTKVEVVPSTTPEAFVTQADEVRQSMEPGERYGDISSTDRKKVEADMAEIVTLLERAGSVKKLRNNEWVLLVNAQEHANALLTKNDGDRLICRYEKRAGSHFRVKTCETARDFASKKRETRRALHDMYLQHPDRQ